MSSYSSFSSSDEARNTLTALLFSMSVFRWWAALWVGGEVVEVHEDGFSGIADFLGEVVEAVEALIVGGQNVGDAPGCEDEERAPGAGLEASALGLPVWADGFLLQVDDGEALVDGGIDDDALSSVGWPVWRSRRW